MRSWHWYRLSGSAWVIGRSLCLYVWLFHGITGSPSSTEAWKWQLQCPKLSLRLMVTPSQESRRERTKNRTEVLVVEQRERESPRHCLTGTESGKGQGQLQCQLSSETTGHWDTELRLEYKGSSCKLLAQEPNEVQFHRICSALL